MGGGGKGVSCSLHFSGDPGGDGYLGRLLRTEDVGVVPRLGGVVALLLEREAGRLEGVTPLGGVMGGVAESLEPLRCGFFGGLSGGILEGCLEILLAILLLAMDHRCCSDLSLTGVLFGDWKDLSCK